MLTLQSIGVQFGGEVLFDDMNFMVNKGDLTFMLSKAFLKYVSLSFKI